MQQLLARHAPSLCSHATMPAAIPSTVAASSGTDGGTSTCARAYVCACACVCVYNRGATSNCSPLTAPPPRPHHTQRHHHYTHYNI